MPRPSFYASVLSTLVAEKLPPTDDCILEYVVDDGPGQGMSAFWHLAFCFIPCWFALEWSTPSGFPVDRAVCFYVLGSLTLATILARLRGPLPMRYAVFLTDVCVLFLMGQFPSFAQVFLAFVAQIILAWLFVKHYIYLRTADPCSPEDSRRCRQGINRKRVLAFLFSFVALPLSAILAFAYHRDIWRAFVSFMTYNWRGNRAAGIFHSPVGPWRLRVLLFHATVMALVTAFANTGIVLLPFPWVAALLPIVLFGGCLLICWLPALLTMFVCQMLLAPLLPFLPSRQEMSHDVP